MMNSVRVVRPTRCCPVNAVTEVAAHMKLPITYVIPNNRGHVVDAAQRPIPGLYVSGWLATGPVGVIASTMVDAYSVADEMLREWREHPSRTLCGSVGYAEAERGECAALAASPYPVVSHADWQRIDAAERERGKALSKPREKFLTVSAMLEAL